MESTDESDASNSQHAHVPPIPHQLVEDLVYAVIHYNNTSLDDIKAVLDIAPHLVEVRDQHTNCNIIHMACKGRAPLSVMKLLVSRFPEGLKTPNDGGRLPLHNFCSASTDVAQFLVESYPEALRMKDEHGNLPLHDTIGEEKASLDAIKIMTESYPEALKVSNGCSPIVDTGNLPNHVALSRLHVKLDVVKYLAKMCPESLLITNHEGRLPVQVYLDHWDRSENDDAIFFESFFGGGFALHQALEWNVPLPMLKIILKNNPGDIYVPNTQDEHKYKAAHVAALNYTQIDGLYLVLREDPSLLLSYFHIC